MKPTWLLLLALGVALAAPARAQPALDLLTALADLRPLEFPAEPLEESPADEPRMAIHKPKGAGPFPAVILAHTCSGIASHLGAWARALLEAGHVVMVLDSLTQRGIRNNCAVPLRVTTTNGALDAYRALEHLARQPYVDRERVALVGFSWGGMVALIAARPDIAERLPREHKALRFRAVIAVYPHCLIPLIVMPAGPRRIEYLVDADRPLLVLMGAEDEETPPKFCLPRLEELKARGRPVAWQLYPGATHAWDIPEASGFTKPVFFGGMHTYRYDAAVAAASRRRGLEFLHKEMK